MIPVVWLNLHPHDCHPKDHWDTSIFQELILNGYPEWNGRPLDFPRAAVVMIAGRFHADDVEAINRTLGFLDGCVVVIHSDEESLFPWWELEHPSMRLWVMTPAPDTKRADFVRFIGEGWSPGTPTMLTREARIIDCGFWGQVTHRRRHEMAAAIRCISFPKAPYVGALRETDSFTSGMPRRDYIEMLCQTKLAPCPAGPVTADSFRIYEALEAGCIPILDGVDGKGRDATNLWYLFFGAQCPLPIIHDWAKLPTMIEVLLEDWETRAAMIGRWWADRKDAWVREMADDVKAISADR